MAVSQVPHFVHSLKRSYELAFICIRRYLEGTADKGLILKPNDTISLKTDAFFFDVAFACGWGVESSTNPDCVKSHTRCIIENANCPVFWVATMQITIVASIMESEYTALLMAL